MPTQFLRPPSNTYLTFTSDMFGLISRNIIFPQGCRTPGCSRNRHSVTLLYIKTGATEYYHISASLVQTKEYPLPLEHHIRVMSVHGECIVYVLSIYTYIDRVKLLYPSDVNIITLNPIPCIILDNSPKDVIIGLPTIIQHNIIEKLNYYQALHLDFCAP